MPVSDSPAATKPTRPFSVVVSSLVVTGMGLFLCAAGAPAAVLFLVQSESVAVAATGRPHDEFLIIGPPLASIMQYDVQFGMGLGLLGLTCLASGLGGWLRRPWARTTSQLAMGAMVLYWLAAGIVVALSVRAPAGGGPVGTVFMMFFRVAALAVGVAWGAFTAVPIWLLKRRDARQWFGAA